MRALGARALALSPQSREALRAGALARSLRGNRARIMCEILVVVQRGAGRVHLGEVFEKMIDVLDRSGGLFGDLGSRRFLAWKHPIALPPAVRPGDPGGDPGGFFGAAQGGFVEVLLEGGVPEVAGAVGGGNP